MKTDFRKILGTLLIAIAASSITLAIYSKKESRHFGRTSYFSNQTPVKLAGYSNANMAEGGYPDFTEAAAKTVHAVVHIKTSYMQKNNVYDQFFNNNPLYDFFFGQPQQRYNQQPVMAFGSGVILSEDGFIVTNNHVVQDADSIQVTLNDKRIYTAKIVGNDPSTDIAVIKIDEKNLPFIVYGNSEELKVGEWVLAVGNPYNLTSTVTAGIVSAKARNINILGGPNSIESFIQTDAPVNPGNSGGALVNTRGELVGVNAAIASNTGSFTGYSFAIPVNIVKKVVDDIIKFGIVQRGFLGIRMEEVNNKIADKKGLNNLKGVYVNSVVANSSAQEAGIKEGDVVTKVAGIEVNSMAQLLEVIGEHRPGDKVDITLNRDGKEMIVFATLKNDEGNTKLVKKEERSVVSTLGGTFEQPTMQEMRRLGIGNGLKVKRLESGKLKTAGIKEGFIITTIDHQPINSVDDLKNALADKKNGILIEGVYPNGLRYFYGFGM